MNIKNRFLIYFLLLVASAPGLRSETANFKFQEVYSLIQSNLSGVNAARLNDAAVSGLISALQPDVRLITNKTDAASPSNESSSVAKATVYDKNLGYIRFSSVSSSSLQDFKNALEKCGKITGLVLDLRFAGGFDYPAAVDIASQFLPSRQPVLKVDDKTLETSGKTDALNIPVAVVVNKGTEGASEALAAILRELQVAVVIGGNTAGRTRVYKDFPLSTGQTLQIAESKVRLANGQEFSPAGMNPDLVVNTPLEEERFYLQDPYAAYVQPGQAGGSKEGNRLNLIPRRGLNEAELVRRHREGADLEPPPGVEKAAVNVVRDPALGRALDFVKGVAVVRLRGTENGR